MQEIRNIEWCIKALPLSMLTSVNLSQWTSLHKGIYTFRLLITYVLDAKHLHKITFAQAYASLIGLVT